LLRRLTLLKVLKDFTTFSVILDHNLRSIHFDIDFIGDCAIVIVLFEKSHLVLLVYRKLLKNLLIYWHLTWHLTWDLNH
jgi:hypothetical protein